MQRKIRAEEIEEEISKYNDIETPIEDYKKNVFISELDRKIQEGEEDIEKGKIYKARNVFQSLREKYGY